MSRLYTCIVFVVLVIRIIFVIFYDPDNFQDSMILHEPRKFKTFHQTSLFVILQQTQKKLSDMCEKSWLKNADDYYIFPKNNMKKTVESEEWTIDHLFKLFTQTYLNLPHQSRWILFTFDKSYFFTEKLIKELSKFDSHQPLYAVIRDVRSNDFHWPAVILSRNALDNFYENIDKCHPNDEDETIDGWLQGCLMTKQLILTRDGSDRSRCFALKRHFEINEMQTSGTQDDGFEFIHKHSSNLLSFTNLTDCDLTLLPILIERVHGNYQRHLDL